MRLTSIGFISLVSSLTLQVNAAGICQKGQPVFYCQTQVEKQVSICHKNKTFLYDHSNIGAKPQQPLNISKQSTTVEHYVVEGTREIYSLIFNQGDITFSITANYAIDRNDKNTDFANIIQSTENGEKIVAIETCKIDTLQDHIKQHL